MPADGGRPDAGGVRPRGDGAVRARPAEPDLRPGRPRPGVAVHRALPEDSRGRRRGIDRSADPAASFSAFQIAAGGYDDGVAMKALPSTLVDVEPSLSTPFVPGTRRALPL